VYDRKITTGDITDVWRSMIQGYSIRDFTNPSDKLAAVAGLAEAMQPSLKGDYLFGVWTDDLTMKCDGFEPMVESIIEKTPILTHFMVLGVEKFPTRLEHCLDRASW